MTFEEEWAQIRAEAAARSTHDQQTGTRLNQLDGDGGGTRAERLKVTPTVLTERAGHADTVRGNFASADNATMKETGQIAAGLKGFRSAAAFGTFQERWRDQMTYVQGLLQHGVSGALRTAAADFTREESARTAGFKGAEGGNGPDGPKDTIVKGLD